MNDYDVNDVNDVYDFTDFNYDYVNDHDYNILIIFKYVIMEVYFTFHSFPYFDSCHSFFNKLNIIYGSLCIRC